MCHLLLYHIYGSKIDNALIGGFFLSVLLVNRWSFIDGVPRIGYYKSMDIQKLSMDMATQRLQDQVGTAVMGMALKGAKEQGSELAKMLETATLPTVRDSALGNRLDIQA